LALAQWIRRGCDHAPSLGADLDRPPALIGKVEVDASGMLGDAEIDRPLEGIELGAGLEQVQGRADRRRDQASPVAS
jgi:hypothetical protein